MDPTPAPATAISNGPNASSALSKFEMLRRGQAARETLISGGQPAPAPMKQMGLAGFEAPEVPEVPGAAVVPVPVVPVVAVVPVVPEASKAQEPSQEIQNPQKNQASSSELASQRLAASRAAAMALGVPPGNAVAAMRAQAALVGLSANVPLVTPTPRTPSASGPASASASSSASASASTSSSPEKTAKVARKSTQPASASLGLGFGMDGREMTQEQLLDVKPSAQESAQAAAALAALAPKNPNEVRISGRVTSIRMHSAEEDFYIFQIQPLGTSSPRDRLSVKGHGLNLVEGMDIVVRGEWITHPTYGRQIEKAVTSELMPVSSDGIKKLLVSGFAHGIGPESATRLLSRFGNKLLDVAERQPELLHEVPGVTQKQILALVAAVKEKRAVPRIMSFLMSVSLGAQMSHRVYRLLGSGAVELIKRNPYELTQIPMIGFAKADLVARTMGVPLDSERRIVAAMEAALERVGDNGSTALPVESLKQEMHKLLSIKDDSGTKETATLDRISEVVEAQINDSSRISVRMLRATALNTPASAAQADQTSGPESVESSQGNVQGNDQGPPQFVRCASLTSTRKDEQRIAGHLVRLSRQGAAPAAAKADLSDHRFAHLDQSQLAAARTSLASPVSIITGRPGCGKTTVTKSIIDAMEAAGLKVMLVAPTGKAAKRMTEATGRKATTMHRALQSMGSGKFNKDESNPLVADVIFADEYSMTGTRMTERFLRAIKTGTQLVLVGDKDQLASIDAGNVFADIITSGVVPVSLLTKIHRQAANSTIKANAHRIINGLVPIAPAGDQDKDFELINCSDKDQQVGLVAHTYKRLLEQGFSNEDIQVLTPMRQAKDPLSSTSLNNILKEMVNPASIHSKAETVTKGKAENVITFNPGDRIMQLANNKDLGIFNGDVGYIIEIDKKEKKILCNFDDEIVTLAFSDVDALDLAYATTIHKSQGSEYKAVIIPISRSHSHMMDRNLLYTAESRGKQRVVMTGDLYKLESIVRKTNSAKRITGLQDEIEQAFINLGANHGQHFSVRNVAAGGGASSNAREASNDMPMPAAADMGTTSRFASRIGRPR